MSYVFDNGPFSSLFRNYYPSVFPTLWSNFDTLIAMGGIISVREVAREIDNSSIDTLRDWAKNHSSVFQVPTPAEASFITEIYRVNHFRQNIEAQKILKGGLIADPFVIAKAKVESKTVVTTEKFKPHSAKIPNICQHFSIACMTPQEFMEAEGWTF